VSVSVYVFVRESVCVDFFFWSVHGCVCFFVYICVV